MKTIAALLLLAANLSWAATPPDARAIIGKAQALPPGSVNDAKAVMINGIEQWISVRGADPKNPILLFIHGGPGSPMLPLSWTFQRPWEDFFTVAEWDQRGAGKTFSLAKRHAMPLTVAQMQSDAEEVVRYLRRTYGKDRIFVMGHSWGSILGLTLAQRHPEWLYAYIGVGQVVDSQRNEAVGYQETLSKAREAHNVEAAAALEKIAPYPDAGGSSSLQKVIVERHWDLALGGMRYGKTDDDADEVRRLSPAYDAYDRQSADLGEQQSVVALLPQLSSVSFDNVTDFRCPIFFFAGSDDRTTPTSIVEAYIKTIRAPQKQLFEIPHASHYVVNESPGLVLLHLVNDIRPLGRE
ncbi:MAG TPA: alpha/beta hydrolase [Steroidobacteraceae bacterium]|jgi:pimeloyl-ACP methyl ester carboxylesterase